MRCTAPAIRRREEVLAVGDGLQTDILGAARMGFDAVFVSGGIHAGEPFPEDFAAQNGLGEWEPVAVVDGARLDKAPCNCSDAKSGSTSPCS